MLPVSDRKKENQAQIKSFKKALEAQYKYQNLELSEFSQSIPFVSFEFYVSISYQVNMTMSAGHWGL